MESERILPAIGLLRAIRPDPDRPDELRLTYPGLHGAIVRQRPLEQSLRRTFDQASNEQSAELAAQKLLEYELIETAAALQNAHEPDAQRQLSCQFTDASINLFGAPHPSTAAYLLEQLLTELWVMQTNYDVDAQLLDGLIQAYADILGRANAPEGYALSFSETSADAATAEFGQFLRWRYADVLAVFDGDAGKRVAADGIVELFEAALDVLRRDSFWGDWRIRVMDDSCLSVNPAAKRLIVGSRRTSLRLGELRGLFGHEVLVHALRATNGQRLGREFERGLPGYIHAEEGLGCFVEHALSGLPPRKMYDRYLDVALALGTLDGRPFSRRELFQLVQARKLVRAMAAGQHESDDHITRESWAHVNRIFRGTLGNNIVGVFTRDIAYYQGYRKITRYIIDELNTGTPVDELWEILTVGKFDPTDAAHVIELAGMR